MFYSKIFPISKILFKKLKENSKMRGLIIVLVALVQWNTGYSAYNRENADCSCPNTPASNTQNTSSSSSLGYDSCCCLNCWAIDHIDDIREFANCLYEEFSNMSSDTTSGHSMSYTPWTESIISLTGKTSEELDTMCRLQGDQLVNDMNSYVVSYRDIAQPNFFEWKSADVLQKYAVAGLEYGQVVNNNAKLQFNVSSSLSKPPVYIPLDTSAESEVEALNTGSQVNQPTVGHYNQTIIANADGTVISGSECHKKWIDKVVYDSERPFGEWSVPRDEEWKREEREHFFWFLSSGNITPQSLEVWQRQQEERILALAERYHCTVEEIQEWHRQELNRYRVLLSQYRAQTNDATIWQSTERGLLDWLIHQNSVTREELERWQKKNADKLAQLARQYRITVDEFKYWQIDDLDRLYVFFNDQNNSMISRPNTESLTRTGEQERLEELIRQHKATIDKLLNSIKLGQQILIVLSSNSRGNVGYLNFKDLSNDDITP